MALFLASKIAEFSPKRNKTKCGYNFLPNRYPPHEETAAFCFVLFCGLARAVDQPAGEWVQGVWGARPPKFQGGFGGGRSPPDFYMPWPFCTYHSFPRVGHTSGIPIPSGKYLLENTSGIPLGKYLRYTSKFSRFAPGPRARGWGRAPKSVQKFSPKQKQNKRWLQCPTEQIPSA